MARGWRTDPATGDTFRKARVGAVSGGVDAVRSLAGYRRGPCCRRAMRCCGAGWPSGAIAAPDVALASLAGRGCRCCFSFNSRITVGEWFVTGGFYERDPTYDGVSAARSLIAIWWGTHRLSGYVDRDRRRLTTAGVADRSRAVASGGRPARLVAAGAVRRRGAAGFTRSIEGASVSDSLHGAAGRGLRALVRRGRRMSSGRLATGGRPQTWHGRRSAAGAARCSSRRR